MRFFVRMEDDRVITLWVKDHTSVREVKESIHLSGRTRIREENMVLMCGVEVMEDEACMEQYSRGVFRNQVHGLLLEKREREDDHLLSHTPITGALSAPIDTLISASFDKHRMERNVSMNLCSCLKVRGERDQEVEGRVEWRDDKCELIFQPRDTLLPSSDYYVYLDCQDLCSRFSWTFKTQELPPVRLLAEVYCNDTSECQGRDIITIHRRSASLYQELLLTLLQRFKVKLNSVKRIVRRSLSGKYGVVSTNSDVGTLSELDSLQLFLDTTSQDASSCSQSWTPEQLTEYFENNWVNDASGYICVCGKMSREEEDMVLLDVVKAFNDRADNKDGISTDINDKDGDPDVRWSSEDRGNNLKVLETAFIGTSTVLESKVATGDLEAFRNTLVDALIPLHLISRPFQFEAPKYAQILKEQLSNSCDSLESTCVLRDFSIVFSSLKRRGYAFIEFDDGDSKILQSGLDAAKFLFDLPMYEKEKVGFTRYLGYHNNTLFNKEIFQMRRYSPSCEAVHNCLWAPFNEIYMGERKMKDFDSCYKFLHWVASGVARAVLKELGSSDTYIDSLIEVGDNDSSLKSLSRSNMTAIRYNISGDGKHDSAHCPHHSDISLVTVIPRCAGSGSGLHVYDWEDNQWIDAETDMPKNTAIIFVGECMTKLTEGFLLPCMHDVSYVGPGLRTSLPFQLCPPASSTLDSSQLSSLIDKDPSIVIGDCSSVVDSVTFMEEVSSSRISSNYPNLF